MNTDGLTQILMKYGTKVALIAIIISIIMSIAKGKNLSYIAGQLICSAIGLYIIWDPMILLGLGKILFNTILKLMEVIGNEITKA